MGQTPAQPELEPGGSESAVTAALAYLWFPAILWLLLDSYKKNRFVRFHSFQALALGGFIILVGFLLGQVPVLGLFLVILWELFAFGLWIMCVVMAVMGKPFKLPVIGDFAEVEFRRLPTKQCYVCHAESPGFPGLRGWTTESLEDGSSLWYCPQHSSRARPTLKCTGCSREPLPGVFVPGRVVVGGGFGRCEKCGKVWCSNCARRYDHGTYFLHACPRCDEVLSSDLFGE